MAGRYGWNVPRSYEYLQPDPAARTFPYQEPASNQNQDSQGSHRTTSDDIEVRQGTHPHLRQSYVPPGLESQSDQQQFIDQEIANWQIYETRLGRVTSTNDTAPNQSMWRWQVARILTQQLEELMYHQRVRRGISDTKAECIFTKIRSLRAANTTTQDGLRKACHTVTELHAEIGRAMSANPDDSLQEYDVALRSILFTLGRTFSERSLGREILDEPTRLYLDALYGWMTQDPTPGSQDRSGPSDSRPRSSTVVYNPNEGQHSSLPGNGHRISPLPFDALTLNTPPVPEYRFPTSLGASGDDADPESQGISGIQADISHWQTS